MNRYCIILIFLILNLLKTIAQKDTLVLSLEQALELANDSSLQAFRSKNLYMASYWKYKNYESTKLPGVSLNLSPSTFNRSITRQFVDSTYKYVPSENFSSSGNLRISQNLPFSGGSLYATSNLTRFQNIEPLTDLNYNATLFSIGYEQPVFGFNEFRWQRKTEPLGYEIAKKKYIQSREEINLAVLPVFFNLARAALEMEIASKNASTADTLYKIGQERFLLASIDKGDLLTLKLEWVNSRNNLLQAGNEYARAHDALINFLRLEDGTVPRIIVPEELPGFQVLDEQALSLAVHNNPFYLDLDLKVLQAERQVEYKRINSRFNSSLNASIGYNQKGPEIMDAYTNPSEQQYLSVSISVPLVDWGAGKSQYYIARNERDALKIANEQSKQDFEQDIRRLISEFNLQARVVESYKEASEIAQESYEIYKKRYILGGVDVNTLGIQQNKKDNALQRYLSELQKYWNYYYTIRKLTLYDFETDKSLEDSFDQELFEP
jgi:outer membrane protein TolC